MNIRIGVVTRERACKVVRETRVQGVRGAKPRIKMK
jgi:hypothetical protein